MNATITSGLAVLRFELWHIHSFLWIYKLEQASFAQTKMGIIPELVLDPDHEIICDYVLLTSQLNTHISSDTLFSRILDVKKKI